MKAIPAGLADQLAGGTTTLCWCWRLIRSDGVQLGFTDHDRDLEFDGTTFEAAAGFTASEITDAVGLGVDNLEVETALSSGRLQEDHLAAGLYDDAQVEIFRVDWNAPDQRVLMRSGSIGEVRRSGLAFTAEVRGLAHYLQQPGGRLYQYGCDADLGDQHCGIDQTTPAHRGAGTLTSTKDNRTFTVDGLGSFATGWFTRGLLTFSTGSNAGRRLEIRRHAVATGGVTLELWQEPAGPLLVGDAFIITVGCDKQFETCRVKFANTENFRGFPHMPGNDFLTSIVRSSNT